jgi:uncharacterized protein with HEPN domain
MPHDLKKSVWDAWNACRLILEFTDGVTLENYYENALRRSAVERQFEILGEAFNRIDDVDPSYRDRFSEMGEAIGMRNRMIHGYDRVNNEIVWLAAKKHIPILMAKLAACLETT